MKRLHAVPFTPCLDEATATEAPDMKNITGISNSITDRHGSGASPSE